MRYKYTILQYACSMHTDFVFPLLKPDKFREKIQKKKDKRSRMLHGDPNPLHTVTTTDHPEHPVGIHVLIVFCIFPLGGMCSIFDCTPKTLGLIRSKTGVSWSLGLMRQFFNCSPCSFLQGRWLDHVMQARDLRKMFVVPAAPSHFYRSKFLLLNSQSVEA